MNHDAHTPTTVREAAQRTARVWRYAWWPAVQVLLAATAVYLVGFIVIALWFRDIAIRQSSLIFDAGRSAVSTRGWVLIAVEVGLPALILTATLVATSVIAVSRLVDDVIESGITADGNPSVRSALRRGVRRAPAMMGAVSLVLLALAGVVAATPILVLTGVVALLGAPVVALVRRRGHTGFRWPAPTTALALAVPLVPFFVLAFRWALVVPAVALERNGPRRALHRSSELVKGRWVTTAATLSFVVVALALVESLIAGVAGLFLPDGGVTAVRIIAQLPVTSVPIMLVTVLFRMAEPTSPPSLGLDDPAPSPAPVPFPLARATAVTVSIALLASSLVLTAGLIRVEPAAADTVAVVNDLGDGGDAVPGDGSCATASATCTLRAAIDEANALGGEHHQITFGVSGTIYTGATFVVTGDVDIDA